MLNITPVADEEAFDKPAIFQTFRSDHSPKGLSLIYMYNIEVWFLAKALGFKNSEFMEARKFRGVDPGTVHGVDKDRKQ